MQTFLYYPIPVFFFSYSIFAHVWLFIKQHLFHLWFYCIKVYCSFTTSVNTDYNIFRAGVSNFYIISYFLSFHNPMGLISQNIDSGYNASKEKTYFFNIFDSIPLPIIQSNKDFCFFVKISFIFILCLGMVLGYSVGPPSPRCILW